MVLRRGRSPCSGMASAAEVTDIAMNRELGRGDAASQGNCRVGLLRLHRIGSTTG
jgi:hypothetical protein